MLDNIGAECRQCSLGHQLLQSDSFVYQENGLRQLKILLKSTSPLRYLSHN